MFFFNKKIYKLAKEAAHSIMHIEYIIPGHDV
jgi:hypothetical protein